MADQSAGYTLITGASSGLGAGIAKRLSRSKRLLLHGRDIDRLLRVKSDCFAPESHMIWPQDLANPEQAARELGRRLSDGKFLVTEFVHSAGMVSVQSLRHADSRSVETLFAINIFAAMCLIPILLQTEALASVVFISSAASLCGEKGVVAYAASKGAVNSITRCLAVELAPAIRVNAVLPGLTNTPMSEPTLSDETLARSLGSLYPLGFGECEDVAAVVDFLLSPQSRWITGQCVVVDGGRTLM